VVDGCEEAAAGHDPARQVVALFVEDAADSQRAVLQADPDAAIVYAEDEAPGEGMEGLRRLDDGVFQ
jgi:hypothetical protein